MAFPLAAVVQGIAVATEVISGVQTVFGLLGGKSQGTFAGGPLGGAPVATGALGVSTSVGPIGSVAGGEFVQAGFAVPGASAILPAIKKAAPFIIGGILGEVVTGNGVPKVQGRRQQILAVARANSPGATSKKIIRSAKECGIELSAATFGLNVLDVCFLLAQPPSRRSRGISAADMRRTRSTIRKVSTIQKSILALSGPIRRRK